MNFSAIQIPKNDTIELINSDIQSCDLLKMYPDATQPVTGDGPSNSQIMFIGEAPGAEEDKQGKPFVGRSGKLLTQLLEESGIKRENVYITNIVKLRPPNNRDPKPKEKDKWFPFLIREIHAIKPLIIATLGRHSMGHFLKAPRAKGACQGEVKISEAHGQMHIGEGIWSKKQIFMPLYHPAVALYSSSKKSTLLADMQKLAVLLSKIKKENFYE
jgi:DNA polymerase